jgi:trehalose 6-phosphate synthase
LDLKGSPLGQLIVVSNRVAIPEKSTSARAGGLAVAVSAALKERSGIWFGWSGKIAAHGAAAAREVVDNGITYVTLDLIREDHQEYYRGFANRVLWQFSTTASISPSSPAAI